jgi:AraC family transcriptional regulator, positive regulator of tynA and feaB
MCPHQTIGRHFCVATTGDEMQKVGGLPEAAFDYEEWRVSAQAQSMCGQNDLEMVDPKDFAGRAASICGFAGADLRSGADTRIERTHRHIRLDGVDHYTAVFQIAGQSTFIQDDRAMKLASGDVALVDSTRPSTYVSDGFRRLITLNLPRQALISHLGVEPEGGWFKRDETLAGRSLFRLVRDAINENEPSIVAAEPYMQLAVYDLVGALFATSDLLTIASPADKLFRRVCGIVKSRFSNPDIGAREVAAEAGISLRYLQKIFTIRGTTCSLFIQSLRLEHAARLLHGRALMKTGQPISEIAYACGFRNYTHFARTFRDRFGHPPGALAGGQNISLEAVRPTTTESAP